MEKGDPRWTDGTGVACERARARRPKKNKTAKPKQHTPERHKKREPAEIYGYKYKGMQATSASRAHRIVLLAQRVRQFQQLPLAAAAAAAATGGP